MTLKKWFEKQTGLEAPIEWSVSKFIKTDLCNCLSCNDNCQSCWNSNIESTIDLVLTPNYLDEISKYQKWKENETINEALTDHYKPFEKE